MPSFTLDIYKDWTADQLKVRCRDLSRSLHKWQFMAMALSEHGRDGLTPSDREKIDKLIEAYRD